MSVSSSPEFFINCKKVPFWDRKKHYFEQSLDALQFFEEEWKKITEGVWINGVFIHPWLYFHINFFKTPIPILNEFGKEEEVIMNPPLRDNEWYMAENYQAAELEKKGIFLYGSRRYAKSVMESSILLWNAITRANSKSEIICGSAKDLATISGFLQTGVTNMHGAIIPPTIKNDWSSLVQFGFKEKGTDHSIVHSDIIVKNADAGKDNASEKGAGGAPVSVILDEVGKWAFLELYLSLLPAIMTPRGAKAVVMLSGTSGNEKLSRDAYKVLSDPGAYHLMCMNWDLLENKIPDPDSITWKRKIFGMFTPPQMAYEAGLIKKLYTLDEFLRIPKTDELNKIKIEVTDWANAKKVLMNIREEKKNQKAALTKEKLYHPLDTDECFLSGTENPFPVIEARDHKQKLEETGQIGKDVDVKKNIDNTLSYSHSDLTRVKYPFEGGIHNAPVVFYNDPPKETPYRGEFVSGLDPYKSNESGTNSVGSFYILKRKTDITDPIEIIQASYASRPTTMNMFNYKLETLIEGWNAECLMENADQSFIQYLDAKGKTTLLLADGVDWSQSINANSNPRTRFGFYPTDKNISYLFDLVVSYCWETIHCVDEETGEHYTKLGVEFIPDPDLLQEIIDWKAGENFDRIRAFGAALAWARHLDKMRVQPRPKNVNQQDIEKKRAEARALSRGVMRIRK